MKVSVIFTCHNLSKYLRYLSEASLHSLRMNTPPDLYELIIVDTFPANYLEDPYKGLDLDKAIWLKPVPDPGYAEAMNMGAEKSSGEYLCFMENDIFVFPNWLENLVGVLDKKLADAVVPDQLPKSYEKTQADLQLKGEEALSNGIQEQGLLLIRKETFETIGKWDKKYRAVYTWRDLRHRLAEGKFSYVTSHNVKIAHAMGSTYYYRLENDFEGLNRLMAEENV